jgi:hypothetical protein
VEFAIIYPPKEKGKYRILVGYYDDEGVVKVLKQKSSNLTDEEKTPG